MGEHLITRDDHHTSRRRSRRRRRNSSTGSPLAGRPLGEPSGSSLTIAETPATTPPHPSRASHHPTETRSAAAAKLANHPKRRRTPDPPPSSARPQPAQSAAGGGSGTGRTTPAAGQDPAEQPARQPHNDGRCRQRHESPNITHEINTVETSGTETNLTGGSWNFGFPSRPLPLVGSCWLPPAVAAAVTHLMVRFSAVNSTSLLKRRQVT
jgi:hypothetical protein